MNLPCRRYQDRILCKVLACLVSHALFLAHKMPLPDNSVSINAEVYDPFEPQPQQMSITPQKPSIKKHQARMAPSVNRTCLRVPSYAWQQLYRWYNPSTIIYSA